MTEDKTLKWWSSPRALVRHILGLDDTHHSIAMGTTVGMFIGMTPTVGIQMVIVMCVAILTKRYFNFNRVAALITVYISNPVTMIPIYYLDYKVGALFFGGDVSRDEFAKILEYEDFAGWWTTICELFVGIGVPLVVGSLVVASLCAAVTYPTMRWLLKKFRRDGDGGSLSAAPAASPEQTVAASLDVPESD